MTEEQSEQLGIKLFFICLVIAIIGMVILL